MRNTPDAKHFIELAKKKGVKAAITERDKPFSDYSMASDEDQPDPTNIVDVEFEI